MHLSLQQAAWLTLLPPLARCVAHAPEPTRPSAAAGPQPKLTPFELPPRALAAAHGLGSAVCLAVGAPTPPAPGAQATAEARGPSEAGYVADEQLARVAIARGVRGPRSYLLLGFALSRQQRLREAEAAFALAIQVEPACAVAHAQLGSLLLARGRMAAARLHADNVIDLYFSADDADQPNVPATCRLSQEQLAAFGGDLAALD